MVYLVFDGEFSVCLIVSKSFLYVSNVLLFVSLAMFPIKIKFVQTLTQLKNDANPVIIDGADIYDALCPVNKLTGCRANPLELLRTLSNDPKRSRLLDSLMVELPTIASDSRLSDDDKIDMMMCRLSTGCPAEDDLYRSQLEKIAEPLFRSLGSDKSASLSDVDSSIKFETSDASVSENS